MPVVLFQGAYYPVRLIRRQPRIVRSGRSAPTLHPLRAPVCLFRLRDLDKAKSHFIQTATRIGCVKSTIRRCAPSSLSAYSSRGWTRIRRPVIFDGRTTNQRSRILGAQVSKVRRRRR